MESYLIDSEILEQVVDSLINEKYPNGANVPADLKKRAMLALDNQILRDIISSLTKEQGQELNALLDNDSNPEVLDEFFTAHGIDLEKILQNTMANFKRDFLEGSKNE